MSYVFTFTAQRNALHAPHLYDWYFDGVDDYISLPNTGTLQLTELTLATRIKYVSDQPTRGWQAIIDKGRISMTDWWLLSRHNAWNLVFGVGHSSSLFEIFFGDMADLSFHDVICSYSLLTNLMIAYFDSSQYTIIPGITMATGTKPIWFGRMSHYYNYWEGIMSFFAYFSTAINDAMASSIRSRIINALNLRAFLDATFYDGTSYVDLSGYGNHGTPYGVTRVEAESKWIWTITDRYSDNLAHVLIPAGVYYVLREANNNSVIDSGVATTIRDVSFDYAGNVKLYIRLPVDGPLSGTRLLFTR